MGLVGEDDEASRQGASCGADSVAGGRFSPGKNGETKDKCGGQGGVLSPFNPPGVETTVISRLDRDRA